MDSLSRIEEIGFRRVGRWTLVAGKAVFNLDAAASAQKVLYAFVTGRDVLYVGKTTLALKRRMYGYQQPGPTQRTNIAGHAKISELLASQRSVDIYALLEGAPLHHGAFQINLAAGLEDSLVHELQPPWNKVGK